MAKKRDDFHQATKDAVAKRAAFICSNLSCRCLTLSPSENDPKKFIYTGEIAHITAASVGGPRYDSGLTSEERSSVDNAIFLCARCATMIDKNQGLDFPTSLLQKWRNEHEQWVSTNLNKSPFSVSQEQHERETRHQLARLEFLHDCSRSIDEVRFMLPLKHPSSPEQLGHFGFLVTFINTRDGPPCRALHLAGLSAYTSRLRVGDSEQTMVGIRNLVWTENPNEELIDSRIHYLPRVRQLQIHVDIHKSSPFPTLGDLDGKTLYIYLTEPLFEQIAGLILFVDNYRIASLPQDRLFSRTSRPSVNWPVSAPQTQDALSWLQVFPRVSDSEISPYARDLGFVGWNLDFSAFTPSKR